ncbi:hypothetical protein TCAL_00706 [Tigriopus californicus]|uniref:C2H2-type domain-containing protein n=1 Tax=Tigriopus californicus TaxID=6832 RepID=A0A553PCP2_TIGCA|nr:hypothetical protein TCAL_00706 [Tigriopus californicus]|eukprot:TCALIF_00706-PA protein Name:"Similar to GLIS3 Zinc finger protein GLIS3 (Homo sapiens)" AED:0.15 eAED:0.15 QI:22/0.85/0.62/1/0.71/0.87/8/460/1183
MDLRGPPPSVGGSTSPYLFRPILEPPEDGSKVNSTPHSGWSSSNVGTVSTTQSSFVSGVPISSVGISGGNLTSAERLSVTSRIRINSGSSALTVNSPTNSLSVNKAPKLYNCWRSSQEAWSSQGSRQSSRPGSSASSRPSSQCNNLLYNKSNNNSLTDVSVARNFQQLSVSTRRAAFKTQKWSHSFDQSCVTSSAQTSPGRRRQASLKQKSLDLDSGYLGSSNGDLKSSQSSYSQSSWVNDYPHNSFCSPIADATLELRELCSEVEEQEHSRAHGVSYAKRGEDPTDDLSRSSSLPSFPETFSNPISLRQHILESQQNRLPILESAQDLSTVDQDEEHGDDLDEEIKMIVALGESQPPIPPKPPLPTLSLGDDEVQSFLDTHCAEEGPMDPPPDNETGAQGDYTVDAVLIVPPLIQRPHPRAIRLPAVNSLRYSASKPQTPLSPQDRGESAFPSHPSISIKEESPEVKMGEDPSGSSIPSSPKSLVVTTSISSESSSTPATAMHLEAQLPTFDGSHSTQFFSDDLIADHHHHGICCGSPGLSPFRPVGTSNGSTLLQTNNSGCERIFQFPPAFPSGTTNLDLGIKEEPWMMSSLHADPFTSSSGTPPPTSQYSPMAISPNIINSSLNTPRGSITSMRSHQQSPMHTDVNGLDMGVDPLLHQHSHHPQKEASPLSFLNTQDLLFHPDNGSTMSMYDNNLSHENLQCSYPSPPRSGYNSPVPNHPQHLSQQQQPHQIQHHDNPHLPTTLPPPSYEQAMQMNYSQVSFVSEDEEPVNHQQEQHQPQHLIQQQQQQQQPEMQTDLPFYALVPKSEPDITYVASPILIQRNLYGTPKGQDMSSSGPETPDSSVKEEMLDSPDTGKYVCLWLSCHEEFGCQKALVDHVNDTHMETKKGCDELPCHWKDCPRRMKPFNAKYKLLTHMRVHTKEKPYKCEHDGCERAFARLENRKIHFRSHTGDKPFSCKFAKEFNCTKKFSNSSDRAKHEQTHKDPKPYRCEVVGCTKRYTDPSSLRKHVKSHTLEEQDQYRRFKDQVNVSKRSSSPRFHSPSRPSSTWSCSSPSWRGGQSEGSNPAQIPVVLTNNSTTSSLMAGGRMINMEQGPTSPSSVGQSPLRMEHLMQTGGSAVPMIPSVQEETMLASQNKGGFLVHQPNSLDDLDGDSLPLDEVPIRFDDNFDLTADWVQPHHS